jgi:hypothetical protein
MGKYKLDNEKMLTTLATNDTGQRKTEMNPGAPTAMLLI